MRAVQTLTSEFPYHILKQFEFRVMKLIQRINSQFNFLPKQAPIIPTNDAFKIKWSFIIDEIVIDSVVNVGAAHVDPLRTNIT